MADGAGAAAAGAAAGPAEDADEGVPLDLEGSDGDWWLVKVAHSELAAAIAGAVDDEVIGSVVVKSPVEDPAAAAAAGRARKRKPQREVKLVVDETLAKRHAAARAAQADTKPAPGGSGGFGSGGGGASQGRGSGALHREYTMEKKPVTAKSMLVLAEEASADPDAGVAPASAAVEGSVTNNFALRVDDLSLLRDRFSQRVAADLVKETTAAVKRPFQMAYNPRAPERMEQLKRARAAKNEKPAAKTTAYGLSSDDIRVRLFKRFEDFTYYSLSDLAKLEKLPQSRVREVLVTIADKEEEGEHRNKWALKPAYRT